MSGARANAARWRVLLPCVAAAIAGTFLSVEAWDGSRLGEQRLAELELNARSEDYRSVLQTGIDNYIDKIQSLQALFGTMPNVSRQQFLDYANALLGGHPAILAVSWVPRVSNAERAQHERMGLREGYVNYQIRSQQPDGSLGVAPPASEYFPVLYSSVATPTTPWVGVNMDDGQIRGRALARVRATGSLVTSQRVLLLSRTGDGSGFFVMIPVYRPGQARDTAEGRHDVLGIVQ